MKRNPISDEERRRAFESAFEEEKRFAIYKRAWFLRRRKAKSIGGTKPDGK